MSGRALLISFSSAAVLPLTAQEASLSRVSAIPQEPVQTVQSVQRVRAAPGDDDFGKQVILPDFAPEAAWLSVQAGTGILWTDNAGLAEHGGDDDWILTPQASLTLAPQLAEGLYAEATVRWQSFLFDRRTDLDFDWFNAGAGLLAAPEVLGGSTVFLRYNHERLTDSGDDLFRSHGIQAGIARTIALAAGHDLAVTLWGDWSAGANPSRLRHHGYEARAVWRWQLAEALRLETGYRFQIEDYTGNSRRDLTHGVSTLLAWDITDWLTLTPVAGWSTTDSRGEGRDHDEFTAGLYLSAHLAF